MGDALERRVRKLQSILDVAKALAAQRELDPLLEMILAEAAKVVEADRCTLYLLDVERGVLWSKIAHGASRIEVPLGVGIAGAVGASGEAVVIPDAYADPRFNRQVDAATGYRTRSILCVPMKNSRGELVGVLQALNRRDGPFGPEDAELLSALGGQAAVALENALLHEDIERLFEGFVRASVVAIESRDPSTAGHSERVARLTEELARSLAAWRTGPYAGLRFEPADMRQLRYAALLHDFGKVGVREHVLVKASKLHPHERERIAARFALLRQRLETERLEARLEGRPEGPADERLGELDALWEVIEVCNRPTVTPTDAPALLARIAGRRFRDQRGEETPYLLPEEVRWLSTPQGSLSEEERREVESHVTHTFQFLRQIPWTRALRRVPEIAFGHHEKLDGRGYPRGQRADGIGVETRMMTIADIYDALTATDRPYKKAVSPQAALDILAAEARSGKIDAALLEAFAAGEAWRRSSPP